MAQRHIISGDGLRGHKSDLSPAAPADSGAITGVFWGEAAWINGDTQRGARTQAIRGWAGRWPTVARMSGLEHIAGVTSGLHHQSISTNNGDIA